MFTRLTLSVLLKKIAYRAQVLSFLSSNVHMKFNTPENFENSVSLVESYRFFNLNRVMHCIILFITELTASLKYNQVTYLSF